LKFLKKCKSKNIFHNTGAIVSYSLDLCRRRIIHNTFVGLRCHCWSRRQYSDERRMFFDLMFNFNFHSVKRVACACWCVAVGNCCALVGVGSRTIFIYTSHWNQSCFVFFVFFSVLILILMLIVC